MQFPGVAVIIGAGTGIGRATAKLFVKQKCSRIVIADRNVGALKETKQQMLHLGNPTEILDLECDVSSEDSVEAFFSKAVGTFGRLDYACNVAGILKPGTSPSYSAADFDKQYSINTRGMWLCQRSEIIQMLKQEPLKAPDSLFAARGAIANVASMAGLRVYADLPSYCATKHAVIGFTKADALFYAKDLIRINAVCPGVIATPMLGDADNVDEMTSEMATGRAGLPEEVAEALVWATSGRASFMTSTTLAINGGMVGA